MILIDPETRNDLLEALALSERFLLWNVRAWACNCRSRRLPAEPVRLAFRNIGIPSAAVAIDTAMTHLVLATRRPLAVNCPPHKGLSGDETMLLSAAAAAQRQDSCSVRELLGEVLPLPALGLVVDALLELGQWLATVGIVLPSSRPRTDSAPPGPVTPRILPTFH